MTTGPTSSAASTTISCGERSPITTVVEVKGTGDGLMVVFPAAAEAVGGAVDIQKGVHRFNRGVATGRWVFGSG